MRILITVFRFLKLVSLRSLWITARREEEGHGWRAVGEVVGGGTRPELSTHLRKFLWLVYMGKMCGTNLLRKI